MIIKNFKLRITNWLLFLWLVLIPTQLGRHWWLEWSYVNGLRVDYLSPTLYLVDVVWGLWVITNFKLRITNFKNKRWWLGLGLVVVNVVVATNGWAAVYRWTRILQLIMTCRLVRQTRRSALTCLRWVVPIWIVVESWLGWSQIINGGSLQGWWYWLGERRFSYLTVGVASWEVWGRGLIRAYGTFSHPNSMAGFLLVSLMIWTSLIKKRGWWYWLVVGMGMVGIIVSGSRTVWLLGLLVMSYQLRVASYKKVLGVGLVVVGVIVMILAGIGENYRIGDFVGGWDGEGVNKRVNLSMTAIKMIGDSPLFGVGLNNFLVKLPEYQTGNEYWLQPVHNIPLLLLTELGVLGILIFNFQFSIFKQLKKFLISKKKDEYKLMLWGVILATGMVDHYWLTLPQNMWLVAIVAGLWWSKIGDDWKNHS